MTTAEREIARQRAALLKVETNGLSEIVRSYQVVLKRLNQDLVALDEKIEAARAAHRKLGPSWLVRQERYQALIAQHEKLTLGFLKDSLAQIEGTKGAAAGMANGHAPTLTAQVMGPGPADGQSLIARSFSTLPERQIEFLVRHAADGRTLGALLAEIAPETTQAVKDALVGGVARGAGVRDIASDVRKASGIAQNRALLISRTEVIRSYRETSRELYQRANVVTGWTWYAETNACPVCCCEHGSEHTPDETLESHPGCRCSMVPMTKSWAELGYDGIPDRRLEIESGADRFAGLPEAEKLAVLGRARLNAYNAGEITLADMVRQTKSARWGSGKRVASLAELGVG